MFVVCRFGDYSGFHHLIMPIGILDSGVGGLTVCAAIVERLPEVSTIYLGDSKNCPYGTKTEEEIWELTKKLVEYLVSRNVGMIVVACNTISVTALERLRVTYPNIQFIGTVPAVKTAVAESVRKRIGILSTPRTAGSVYQRKLIEEFATDCFVLNLGSDKLTPLVEAGELDGERVMQVLQTTLQPFIEAEVDVLVLGCTHFPFLKAPMQRILGNGVRILDSGAAIAKQVERVLQAGPTQEEKTEHEFLTSGNPVQLTQLLHTMERFATMQATAL